LKVGGDIYLSNSLIKGLPEGLKVDGDLFINDTDIELLPKDLEVKGELMLRECNNLKLLPKGLKVHKNLYISKSTMGHYSNEELIEMIYPGFIKGKIVR